MKRVSGFRLYIPFLSNFVKKGRFMNLDTLTTVIAVIIPIFVLLLSSMGWFFKKMYEKLDLVNEDLIDLKTEIAILKNELHYVKRN
jgi:hypothetical protein